MGLFWSLEPCPGQGDGIRLVKKDVTSPIVYNLLIIRETAIDPVRSTPDIMAEVKLERLYMKQGVKRVPVKEGRFRGTIFIPEGNLSSTSDLGTYHIFAKASFTNAHTDVCSAARGLS